MKKWPSFGVALFLWRSGNWVGVGLVESWCFTLSDLLVELGLCDFLEGWGLRLLLKFPIDELLSGLKRLLQLADLFALVGYRLDDARLGITELFLYLLDGCRKDGNIIVATDDIDARFRVSLRSRWVRCWGGKSRKRTTYFSRKWCAPLRDERDADEV
jgi:hypothetical protein